MIELTQEEKQLLLENDRLGCIRSIRLSTKASLKAINEAITFYLDNLRVEEHITRRMHINRVAISGIEETLTGLYDLLESHEELEFTVKDTLLTNIENHERCIDRLEGQQEAFDEILEKL